MKPLNNCRHWIAMVPLLVAFAAGAFFLLDIPIKKIDWDSLLVKPIENQELNKLQGPEAYSALTMWIASVYTLLVLALCVIVLTVGIVVEFMLRNSDRRVVWRWVWSMLALVSIGLLITVCFAFYSSRNMDHRLVTALLERIKRHSDVNITSLFKLLDSSYRVGGLLIAIGFCATLLPVATEGSGSQQLACALNRQQWLLYAVALLLAAAVIEMNLLWNWPQVWADGDSAKKQISELALCVSASWGSMFTVFTLAVFASAHFILRRAIDQVAESMCLDPKERPEWRAVRGLTSKFGEQSARALAVLGPALAGGPIAALIQALAPDK